MFLFEVLFFRRDAQMHIKPTLLVLIIPAISAWSFLKLQAVARKNSNITAKIAAFIHLEVMGWNKNLRRNVYCLFLDNVLSCILQASIFHPGATCYTYCITTFLDWEDQKVNSQSLTLFPTNFQQIQISSNGASRPTQNPHTTTRQMGTQCFRFFVQLLIWGIHKMDEPILPGWVCFSATPSYQKQKVPAEFQQILQKILPTQDFPHQLSKGSGTTLWRVGPIFCWFKAKTNADVTMMPTQRSLWRIF